MPEKGLQTRTYSTRDQVSVRPVLKGAKKINPRLVIIFKCTSYHTRLNGCSSGDLYFNLPSQLTLMSSRWLFWFPINLELTGIHFIVERGDMNWESYVNDKKKKKMLSSFGIPLLGCLKHQAIIFSNFLKNLRRKGGKKKQTKKTLRSNE